jgi:hypothetical protein
MSSAQAPDDTQMTVEQMQRLVDEWAAAGYRWDRIDIAGGEPTMHKDFLEILDILRVYRSVHSPQMRIKVLTNGAGKRVQQIMAQIPSDVEVVNSQKEGKRQVELGHATFNLTPEEVPKYANVDYRNACKYTETCGTGLGPSGYYHCGVAAGIDRIFEWNIGRQSLPSEEDGMEDLAERFCRKCAYFLKETGYKEVLAKQVTSPAWKDAYAEYRNRQSEKLVTLTGVSEAPKAVTAEVSAGAPE